MKFVLKNGLKVIIEKRKSDSVSIEAMVGVGSNYENKNISGISHFIEHTLFKGTKTKTAKQISSLIEDVGGRLNAYTSKERTAYHGKVPKQYLQVLLDVLSDMLQNPVFDENELKKEKNVVLSEAKIWKDQPRLNQWNLLEKILWKKHPAKNPIIGTVETIKKIKRSDILNYYKKYYIPNNITLTIVGDIEDNVLELVKKKFENFKPDKLEIKKFEEEKNLEQRKITAKKDTAHSYFVMGYLCPNRVDKDSYVLDIIQVILGNGSSSRLFTEIREKKGLCYEIGASYEAEGNYGYFAIHLSTDKKNIPMAKEIIIKEVEKLKSITNQDLEKAKKSIEGQFLLEYEDTLKLADLICFWEKLKDYNLYKDYIKNIKAVTKEDISKAVNKYLKNYVTVTIEQK